jgi:hypothetical protein
VSEDAKGVLFLISLEGRSRDIGLNQEKAICLKPARQSASSGLQNGSKRTWGSAFTFTLPRRPLAQPQEMTTLADVERAQ